MRTRFFSWLLTVVLVILLCDNILWHQDFPTAATIDFHDPLCLWGLSVGAHQSNEDSSVWENVEPDGVRRSHPRNFSSRPYRVLCIGCSYTFGVAVADEETYVWRLNELMPNVEFVNGGVGGYGPLPSLIREKQLLAKKPYDLVIYAYIDDHLKRNSIPMTEEEPGRGRYSGHRSMNVYTVPIVEMQDGWHWNDSWPRRYAVAGDTFSPFMNFIGRYYTASQVRRQHCPSAWEQKVIFAQIAGRQSLLASGYGCPYLMISLQDTPCMALLPPHIPFFNDCIPGGLLDSDRVGGLVHNHPGGKIHKIWAEQLASYLKKPKVFEKLIVHPKLDQHRNLSDL